MTIKEKIARRIQFHFRSFKREELFLDYGSFWRRFPCLVTPDQVSDFPPQPERVYCSFPDLNPALEAILRHWSRPDWVSGEKKTEIHVVQHGGGFGTMAELDLEEKYLSIADYFHSWGWRSSLYPGTIIDEPSAHLQWMKRKIGSRRPKDGYIYWVLYGMPKEPFCRRSMPQGKQFQAYLEDQFEAISHLSYTQRAEILIRLYPTDYGWGVEEQFRQHFHNIRIERAGAPIWKGLTGAKLVVITANLTTFLESLSSNIPTLALWDFKKWQLRPSAIGSYARLYSKGILQKIGDFRPSDLNIDWNNFKIQQEREDFCWRFART